MKKQSVSFYTLGCRLNQSETAVIERTFEVDGYNIVDFNEPADIVVINTCTVTENGDADTRRLVSKVNRINPAARIALVGCQAQVQKEKLTELPNVHWVVGNAKKFDLRSIIETIGDQSSDEWPVAPTVIVPTIPRDSFTIPMAGIDRHHTRANIKIQDGCDFFCSFCEIPYARGRARSREFTDIVKEAEALAQAGHKEIVLTGINIGTYNHENYSFMDVISALEQINELERIRISSIEPTTIPIDLFKKMAQGSKLCRYLHIPLQSASNNVLANMKRKYTSEDFYKFIHAAHDLIKDICIGTDVIVGFPGETDAQFEDTCNKLREWPIDYFHTFSYSKRTMAKSQHLKDEIDDAVIHQRSETLRDLSARKRQIFLSEHIGKSLKVLFEQKKKGAWSGLTDNYIRVKVLANDNLSNTLRNVYLREINGSDILGEII